MRNYSRLRNFKTKRFS